MIHLIEESRRLLEKLGQATSAVPGNPEKEKETDPLQRYTTVDDFLKDKTEAGQGIDPNKFYVNRLNPNLDMPTQEIMKRTAGQALDNLNAFGVDDPALEKDIENSFYAWQDPYGGGLSTSIMANKMNRKEMDSVVGQAEGVNDVAQNVSLISDHNKGLQKWKDRTVDQFLNENRLGGGSAMDNHVEQDDRRLG